MTKPILAAGRMTGGACRRRARSTLATCLALAAAGAAGACGGSGAGILVPGDLEVAVEVTDVDVSPPTARIVTIGDGVEFTATPRDASGDVVVGATVVWASDDLSVATVSSDGVAVSRSEGLAVITATVDGVVGQALLEVSPRTFPAQTPSLEVSGASDGAGE